MSNDINIQSSFIDFQPSLIKTKFLSKQALKINSLINQYQVKGYLSEDFFGITYIATHKTNNKSVVIREYFPSEISTRQTDGSITAKDNKIKQENFSWGLEQFIQESQTLQNFSHPNIISIKDWFLANGTAYQVTSYHKGQTLKERFSLLKSLDKPPLTETQLLQVFIPILDALKLLHEYNYPHRNIKPENIYLCTNDQPLLIDFGASKQAVAHKMGNPNLSLSLGYAAKELYSGRSNLGPSVDIYAISATLYHVVTGNKPAAALDRGDARDDQDLDPLIPATQAGSSCYRPEFLRIIEQGLAYLPKDRPQTITEFKQQLIEQQYKNKKKGLHKFNFFEKIIFCLGSLILVIFLLLTLAYQEDEIAQFFSSVIAGKDLEESSIQNELKTVASEHRVKNITPSLDKGIIPEEIMDKTTWIDPYTNMTFKWIPSGQFIIGNNTDGVNPDDRELTIEGFWMGIYEVTVGEFQQFVKARNYKTAAGDKCKKNIGWKNADFRQSEKHPVACVSWLDAQAYIRWLNNQSDKKFRLPTEAQWEYACRKDNKKQTYCGDKPLAVIAHYATNSNNKSSAVGLKAENSMGLYDMTGNVWEWIASKYASHYKGQEMQWLNPNTAKKNSKQVIFRGGSWMYEEEYLSSIYRGNPSSTNLSYDDVGFRLVRIE